MKSSPLVALAGTACLLLVVAPTVHSQVPGLLQLTGRVEVEGVPYSGSGQFKFALVDGVGTTTYWSHDGTSSAGNPPVSFLVVAVDRGLYAVLLGDGGMPPVPASVFTQGDVRMRVWFNDGNHGFQQLVPDMRIASVGYAMVSAAVDAGAIATAGIQDASVTAAKIASGQVVKSLNGYRDDVTLSPGANVSLAPSGNGLSISASVPSVSGTPGRVARFTAANGVGDSSIVESSGRIGIGTAAPNGASLHLKSGVVGPALRIEGTGANGLGGQVVFGTTGSTTYLSEAEEDGLYLVAPAGVGLGPGNVGIHVTSLLDVTHALTVVSTDADTARLIGPGPYGSGATLNFGDGNYALLREDSDDHLRLEARSGTTVATDGQVATPALEVLQSVGSGTASPALKLRNTSSGQGIALFAQTSGTDATAVFTQTGSGSILRGFVSGDLRFEVRNNGRLVTQSLEIQGGADVAEPFVLASPDTPAGALVIIDGQQPGCLRISDRMYDRRVAGIVSGAHGIQPGLTLTQEPEARETRPVALSGRVYALADARPGPIAPGDLLTTSGTPGHAMAVKDHALAQGAVVGKAMSRLDEGTGMVLVLVSLQ